MYELKAIQRLKCPICNEEFHDHNACKHSSDDIIMLMHAWRQEAEDLEYKYIRLKRRLDEPAT
jgi:hypothetical protein